LVVRESGLTKPRRSLSMSKTITPYQTYRSTDITAVKHIKAWRAEHNYPLAALARLGRMTEGTLSQLIDGSYPKKPSKLLRRVTNGIAVADKSMKAPTPVPGQTITAFDAEFPYRLTEEDATKLEQLQGLLTVLTHLSGTAALLDKNRTPDFTNQELHQALWGMNDILDSVVTNYLERSKA
jgi:hypothetical protein